MVDILQPHHASARLDAARGLSALFVVGDHVCATLFFRLIGTAGAVALISETAGRQAVLVFFLLSGHLITKSVISNIRRGQFSISDYAAARVARIYPPLIGAVVICAIIWLTIHGLQLPGSVAYGLPGDLFRIRDSYKMTGQDVIGILTMRGSGGLMEADGPLWSLVIEVQIYVLVMAIASFWQSAWLLRIVSVMLGLIAAYYLRHQLFWVVIWGIGAATVFLKPPRWLAIIGVGVMLVVIIAMAVWSPSGLVDDTVAAHALQIVCALFYSSVLFFAHPTLHYPRVIVGTANFSYSVYIIHFPLLMLVLSFSQDWIGYSMTRTAVIASLAVIGILGVVIPFAWLLERPKQFKDWILKTVDLARPATGKSVSE